MTLREADSYGYLRLKETIESRPTDSIAVYQDGKVRPVFIYTLDGKDVFVVEGENYKFYPAQQVPDSVWIRWETKPDPQPVVVEAPSAESGKLKGSSWAELKADAAGRARNALAERNAMRLSQQGVPTGDSALARASREFARVVAAQKGRRN